MSASEYPRFAWGYIFVVPLLGAALEYLLLRHDSLGIAVGDDVRAKIIVAALFVGATLAGLFPVKLGPNQKMNLGTAVEFAAILLFPAALAVAIAAAATILYSAAMRRSWFNVLFSGGQHALVVGGAAMVYAALWSPARPPFTTPQATGAAVAAGIVHVAVAVGVLSGVVAATQRRSLAACVANLARQSGAQYAALIGDGALIAVCVWQAPWAIPLPALALPLIHQLNRALEKLATAKGQVDETLARQRRFVSDIAHEIGTPLTTLDGNLELLRRESASQPLELRETIEDVGSEFRRLASAFSHLLLLAEADEQDTIARHPVRLDTILQELTAVWQQLAETRGLSLELGAIEPTLIAGDEVRLRQMFEELIENATRYTPAGGSVRLELRQESDIARASIVDSGVGIDPSDLPHIFERFYRGKSSRLKSGARPITGSGLGLAIVQWLAGGHGGRVLVESAPGKGSRFTVELPLAANPSIDLPNPGDRGR
ncbi:MAG: sensor histidine kinase [Chloroflexota bacterium]